MGVGEHDIGKGRIEILKRIAPAVLGGLKHPGVHSIQVLPPGIETIDIAGISGIEGADSGVVVFPYLPIRMPLRLAG